MNKVFSILAVFALLNFGYVSTSFAQDAPGADTTTQMSDDSTVAAAEPITEEEPIEEAAPLEEEVVLEKSFHQVVKDKFIAGGPGFMSFVLVCLILGLAICIERILYLTMATTNTKQLIENVEAALKSGGVEAAKEVCRNTKGPVASIFYQGLDRSSEGIDMVEKSVVAYGSVQMGLME